ETQEWKSERLGTGDLASSERGSGARFNAGKPPLDLIPVHVFIKAHRDCAGLTIFGLLRDLDAWQRREASAADLLYNFQPADYEEAAYVLDFGRRKYAEWNWAKGMKWSVPVGC